jgi:hypothetical protein
MGTFRLAGGRPFRSFSVDERSQLDHTTPVRQRRVIGLAFQGARPFALEGSGFLLLLRPKGKKLIRHYGRGPDQPDLPCYTSAGSRTDLGPEHLQSLPCCEAGPKN